MRILVVDDDPSVLRALARSLRGFDLVLASSAAEALAAVCPELPDLVVTDLQMPGIDGLELIGILKSRWPLLPCVLATGSGDYQPGPLGMPDATLPKPWTREDVLIILEKAAQ